LPPAERCSRRIARGAARSIVNHTGPREGVQGINPMLLLLLSGVLLLLLTVLLFMWGIPRGGKPSPVPNKWGLASAFPIFLLATGTMGIVFLLKGIFP
jgi:hypothetical protein